MKKYSLCFLIVLIALLTALVPASAFTLNYWGGPDGYQDPSIKPEEMNELIPGNHGVDAEVDPSAGCYTVDPDLIPTRDGKVFIGWELNTDEFAVVQIRYLELGTNRELYPTYIKSVLTPGEFYTALAQYIDGYRLISADTQEILLENGGPTAEDPWKNTIVFYYMKQSGPQ